MANGTPGWRAFDAESDPPLSGLGPTILPDEGAGRIVAVVATPLARAEHWAERAVVSLAGGWAREGLRIFLMDLCLEDPFLHDLLDLPNQEGVSDAFLYGASVQRIAEPALDGAIFFASAGTATADPEQILAHPRWTDLAEGFTEADATLVLLVPSSISGVSKVLAMATDLIFLSAEGESPESQLGPAVSKLRVSLGPEGVDHEGISEAPGEEVPEDEGGVAVGGGISDDDALDGGTFGLDGDLTVSDPAVPRAEEEKGLDRPLSLAAEFLEGVEGGAGSSELEEGLEEAHQVESGPAEGEGPPPMFGESAREGKGGEEAAMEPGAQPEERTPGGIPDFGVEFADMPSLDEPEESERKEISEEESDFLPGSGYTPEPTLAPERLQGLETDLSPADEPTQASDTRAEEGAGDAGEEAAGETVGAAAAKAPARRRPAAPTPPDPARTRPMARPKPTRRSPFRAPVILVGGLVIVLILAALATATGFLSVPGFGWADGLFGEVPYPALTLTGPEPVNENLRFSLELDTFEEQELNIAVEMRNTLRDRLPDLVFNLSPLSRGEEVSYLLYAGPAVDVVEAENLRTPIREVLIRDDPDSWAIRPTPRAFLLGEAGTLDEARQMMASAEASGALGYILQVEYPDGSVGFRILSGAFDGVEEARYWQLMLRDAGYEDLPLIERRGRPPE